MSNKRHRLTTGFTLIEIVTVVTVLAIVALLALPLIASQTDLNASAAARMMVADLLYAQGQAIATQQMQYVELNTAATNNGWGSYSLFNNAQLATPITDPVALQAYTRTFGSGGNGPLASVALTNVALDNPANTVLCFDELGRPYTSAVNGTPTALANTGTLTLQCGSMSVTVSIEPSTGNITVSP
jgi:prepilin-type N-terminal cleavage/methylation domain-containing protein